jgi:predicted HAD superfamily Cof-like phosphohydrolase
MKTYLQTRVDGFHARMGRPSLTKPTDLSPEDREIHARVAIEEFVELACALVGFHKARELWTDALSQCVTKRGTLEPGALPEIVQECIDSEFVSAGILGRAGVHDLLHLHAVCDANDAKVGGGRNEHGKLMKPPGWTKPDIEFILIGQGWVPNG